MLTALVLLTACLVPADEGAWDTGEAADPQLFLGVCDAWDVRTLERGVPDLEPRTADVLRLRELGVYLARPHRPAGHVFAMNLVERGAGWDWSLPDYVVGTAGEAEVRVLATLQPFTEVRDDPHMAPFIVPAGDLERWSRFVAATVERYDGDGLEDMPGLVYPVHAWEVANEPACDVPDTGCMGDYLATVRTAFEAAHAADPEATVMVGGALPAFEPHSGDDRARATAIYEYFFDHQGEEWTDGMPFHATTGTAEPPLGAYLDRWDEIAPTTIPRWLTESGPYGTTGLAVHPNPQVAADWYVEQLEAAHAAGVEHALWCTAQRDLDERPELMDAIAEFTWSL